MNEDYEPFGDEWRKYMKTLKKDFLIDMIKEQGTKLPKVGDFHTVKGAYLTADYDSSPVAFECRECGSAMSIVEDPVKEQPNYCFNCGVKFDWKGVWEAFLDETYKDMEEK
jgi:hypothetical protein